MADPHRFHIQHLGERLLRAGWATGLKHHDERSFDVTWTEHGLEQLQRLLKPIGELEAGHLLRAGELANLRQLLAREATQRGWRGEGQ